ncbi:MAG: TetR/AcrR family transcriptional regulator [Sphingobium sp.]
MSDLPSSSSGRRLPPRSARGGRPPQDVAAQLGPHILDVALEQFLTKGPENTSMDDIAMAASVSKRTLYARYESKMGLLAACIRWGFNLQMASLPTDIPGETVRQRLFHAARLLLDLSLSPEVLALARLAEWVSLRQGDMPKNFPFIRSYKGVDLFHAILLEAPGVPEQQKEELRFIAPLLFDLLVIAAHLRVVWRELDNNPEDKDGFLEHTLNLVAAGLPFLAG